MNTYRAIQTNLFILSLRCIQCMECTIVFVLLYFGFVDLSMLFFERTYMHSYIIIYARAGMCRQSLNKKFSKIIVKKLMAFRIVFGEFNMNNTAVVKIDLFFLKN